MSQINRIDGGLIDQEKVLNFTFNGQILKGLKVIHLLLRYLLTTSI